MFWLPKALGRYLQDKTFSVGSTDKQWKNNSSLIIIQTAAAFSPNIWMDFGSATRALENRTSYTDILSCPKVLVHVIKVKELYIRAPGKRGIEDNSKIFFLISQ